MEVVTIVPETRYADMQPSARERLTMNEAQRNVLVRPNLRPMDRTPTDATRTACVALYQAITPGGHWAWARH